MAFSCLGSGALVWHLLFIAGLASAVPPLAVDSWVLLGFPRGIPGLLLLLFSLSGSPIMVVIEDHVSKKDLIKGEER